ncbi:MAG TPA: hypothetical protein VK698_28965 [Kofleriaceae bacterium]|nr:hypothetical protein [Kofleriaceae bacterium]
MRRTILALMVAGVLGGAVFGLSGCYATTASVGVGVDAGPPGPVAYYDGYRDGYSWIDGHWVWGGAGWQWYPGYWVTARPGYVYVQGYWDYWGGRWAYRPGLWARSRNGYVWIGGRWRPHRAGYHHYDYRSGRWVGGGRGRGYRVPYRDHRTYRGRGGDVRDHRGQGRPPIRRGRPGGGYHRRR